MSPPIESPEILSLNDLKIHLPPDVYNHLATQYSVFDGATSPTTDSMLSSHMDKILESMKTSPTETCCRVNLIQSSAEDIIDGLRSHTSNITYENHGSAVRCHETLKDLVMIRSRPKQSNTADANVYHCSVPPNPECNNLFPNWPTRVEKGWPMSHRAIVVDRFCGEAVLRGADVFVRGILAADAGIKADEEIAVYADLRSTNAKSVPRGLVLEHYSGRCVFVGIGKSCCKRSDYFAQSAGIGVRMVQIAGPPQPSLNSVLSGKMMLQNLPSVCVAHALDPQLGEVILDMCCAPGGKTTHVASLIKNEGLIIACDKSRKKMVSARDLFRSMGATCIVPLALDSTKSLLDVDEGRGWKSPNQIVGSASSAFKDGLLNVKGFYENSFDRILLDPPCSALGLRPKLLVDAKSSKELSKFAEYQRRFIREAISLLKPGGTMTYSTCTINAQENEDMVLFVLSEFSSMRLVPMSSLPGLPGLPGRGLTDHECQMVRRFDPCDKGDTMGFFLAKFTKIQACTDS
eukprot:CAMPEP_0172530964 /NCGR_PEP_ID=MMETSP1067-20121228/4547_1 /TAXON_ID=265564 ORGANISM="Thalassiosira punctigera, Strain Tpunct2005C2" /NCGR_SAMPLE_ID=MMETSP1067 /ASSEMBLY_ACC=CAM_ASM_000444 /LENGTH=517 /DNA_ID=CAMNT_0013315279 /DNA_START=134 /DNA_END=1687 /DNA_ORIENTATION=-